MRQPNSNTHNKKENTLIKIAALVLTVLLFVSFVRSVSRLVSARQKISETEREVELLQTENLSLKDRLNDVKTDFYVEKETRDKLGLAKEGEIVIILPDEAVLRSLVPENDFGEDFLPDPNWKQWINLFI